VYVVERYWLRMHSNGSDSFDIFNDVRPLNVYDAMPQFLDIGHTSSLLVAIL